jgi:hypothetical protein
MAEIKKKGTRAGKTEPPLKNRPKNAQGNTSGGASSSGGSRQGNIGHESNDTNDNAHR